MSPANSILYLSRHPPKTQMGRGQYFRLPILLLLCCTSAFAQAPQINAAGVVGAGLSSPPVTSVSSGGIVSIFGQNFVAGGKAASASGKAISNGKLPTLLGGVCVNFGDAPAPLLAVVPTQINLQVPSVPNGNVSVQVLSNCGTAQQTASNQVSVEVQSASPEFFYLTNSGTGNNFIAGYNPANNLLLGAPGLLPQNVSYPVSPGSVVTLFATGLGAVDPVVAPGAFATGVSAITNKISIAIGGHALSASDILFAGLSPGFAGLYQLNLRIPTDVSSGNQPVALTVAGVAAPVGYLAINPKDSLSPLNVSAVVCLNDPLHDDSVTIFHVLSKTGYAVLPTNQICYANLSGVNAIPGGSLLTGVPGRSVMRPFNAGQPVIDVEGISASKTVTNITVDGVTFEAVGANLNSARTSFVNFRFVGNLRFVNNIIRSTQPVLLGEAFRVTDSSAFIADNDISDFGIQLDVYVDSANSLPANAYTSVIHNRVHDNSTGGGDGIWVHGPDHGPVQLMPVVVDGNYVTNTRFHTGDTGQTGNAFAAYEAQGVRFENNFALNPSYSCFRSAFSNEIIFTANHCENAKDTGLYSEFSSQRNQWVNNYVNGAVYSCMSLTNFTSSPPGQEHMAIGNQLLNCGAWGIEAEGDIVLKGNLIDHTRLASIQIGYGPQAQFVLARGNIIQDSNPGVSGSTPVGICVEHGQQDIGHVVDGNLFNLTVPEIAGCDHGSIYQGGVLPAGLTIRNQSVPRALLGAPDDGSFVYVPDAAPGDCTKSGSGAFGRRVAGAWVCQ